MWHPPQLASSLHTSVQPPSQHTPPAHEAPQAPQCRGSVARSVHSPSQLDRPGGQSSPDRQLPSRHCGISSGHCLAHPPQLPGSLEVLTQVPPQSRSPGGQVVQTPPKHALPGSQAGSHSAENAGGGSPSGGAARSVARSARSSGRPSAGAAGTAPLSAGLGMLCVHAPSAPASSRSTVRQVFVERTPRTSRELYPTLTSSETRSPGRPRARARARAEPGRQCGRRSRAAVRVSPRSGAAPASAGVCSTS